MQRVQNCKGIVLSHHLVGALFKLVGIVFAPPVAQGAISIILAALAVKTVGHFVADHGADASIIHGVIRAKIKKRKLQDTRREYDLVIGWIVIGIYGRRRHTPAFFVDRFVDLAYA